MIIHQMKKIFKIYKKINKKQVKSAIIRNHIQVTRNFINHKINLLKTMMSF